LGLQPQAQQDHGAREINLNDLRVLVADDNASQRKILREVLEKRGALVAEAGDYAAALDELRHATQAGTGYKLLLLDGCLVDGHNLDEVKEARIVDTTILMLASSDLNHDVERARRLGIEIYLVKPVGQRDLLAAIRAILVKDGAPLEPALPETRDPGHDQRRLRILLAEDSEDNRVLVQAYLKNTPYQLDVAENGDIAVTKFTSGKYDLVLMDMQMPVMDGYTAVKAIREWERTAQVARTPIVALTAYALKDEVGKSLEAGCDAHLSKPIKKKKLLEAIAEATRDWRDSYEKHVAHVNEELAPLLPRFLQRKRDDILAIRDRLEQEDYETVRVLGHNIKGEGGGYGLDALTKIGSSIEEAARVKDSKQLQALVEALATYLNEVEVVYE